MALISVLFKEPLAFVLVVVPLLYSIILHEVSHGLMAFALGDDTAKRMGRLSLNPLKHLDPVGTIALLLVGFGWAKPVPIDYSRMRNFRLGIILVSFAGCMMNIFIAIVSLALLQAQAVASNPIFSATLIILARINILLGALNLIPIPPLDGSRILLGSLPRQGQLFLVRLEPYGMFILFAMIFTGLLNPVVTFMQGMIISLISKLFHFMV